MNSALQLLYAPVEPFVLHPELAYLVAALFAALLVASLARSRKFRPFLHLTVLSAAVAWLLFGLNEVQAKASGSNIRVDLLFSWPVILAISIGAAWAGLRNLASSKPT